MTSTSPVKQNLDLPDVENLTLDDTNSPVKQDLPDVESSLDDDTSTPTNLTFEEPSHKTTGLYAGLMETNEQEGEAWYYFIRMEGNEEALSKLQDQLQQVDHWYVIEGLSTFDLDLEHLVSAQTAKEMTKLDHNSFAFHRKFDGKLQDINLGFRKRNNDETKMCKAYDQLSYGQIQDYISDEDLDAEDLTDTEQSSESDEDEDSGSDSVQDSGSDSVQDSGSDSVQDSGSDSDSGSGSDSSRKGFRKVSRKGSRIRWADREKLPPSLDKHKLPRWAQRKRGNRKK